MCCRTVSRKCQSVPWNTLIRRVFLYVQIQDEQLAQSLGLSTGKYLIKQSANKSTKSQPRPKKQVRKSLREKQSTARPRNSSLSAVDTEVLGVDDSVMQTNDFDELVNTQKLLEFAITSANPKVIGDFEPTQILHSNYLQGPVVKIEEFPDGMHGISDGTSADDDDVLLCYMAQTSRSADNLPVISNNAEQNLSFKQSLMVTAAPVTQSSTLTFPLTLTVDGSSPLDNLQLS